MKKWRLMDSEPVLLTPWLVVYKNQYEVMDGKIISDYYVIKRKDFVLLVALQEDKLILVRQYRPATDRVYLSLPAGFLEPGESPEDGARREMTEETGLSVVSCRLLGELDPLPGYIQSRAYVVWCELGSWESRKFGTYDDEMEIDEVVKVEWKEAVKMIVRGEINEMQAVSAILLAKEVVMDTYRSS